MKMQKYLLKFLVSYSIKLNIFGFWQLAQHIKSF